MHYTLRPGICLLLALWLLPPAHGQPTAEEMVGPPEPDLIEKSLRFAVDARDLLSEQVVWISDNIDSFIGSERAIDEINGSHIRVRQNNTLYEDGSLSHAFTTGFKLDLPRTNERLSLVIESDSQATEGEAVSEDEVEAPPEPQAPDVETQQTSVSSAIQYIIRTTDEWHVRGHTGLQIRETEVDPNAKLRIRRLYVDTPWEYRVTENIFWYLSEGYGETTQLDVERPVVSGLFFRATSKATWREVTDYFDLSQTFTLYQNIGPRRLLSYQAGAYGISEPHTHATAYTLNLAYRQLLYEKWFFMDLVPLLLFPESSNFSPTPSVTVSFEMRFGAD